MEQAAKTKKPWSGKTKVIVTIVSVLLAVALIGALGFVIVFGYLPWHGYDMANDYGFTDSVNSVLDACGITLPEDARFEYSVTHRALRGYSSDIYFTVPLGGADANADGSIDAMAEVVYKTLKLDKKQYPRVREATEIGPSAASEKHEKRLGTRFSGCISLADSYFPHYANIYFDIRDSVLHVRIQTDKV